MKKIFTLLMLVFVAQVTFADDVIASFTFPDANITANPSSAVAGTGCTVTYRNLGFNSGGALNKQLDGKFYHKMNNDNNPITVKLNTGNFQAGDKFYATLYSGSASTDGFYFKSRTGNSKTITYSKDSENTLEYTLTDADINDDGSVSVFRYSTNAYVRHIEVTRAAGATKQDPTTEFAQEIIGFKKSGAPITQAVSTNSDGAVTYESSNTNVVAVDSSTGALTGVAVGKAKITAKTASSSTYSSSSASYTVYVLSDGDGTLENPYLPTDLRYLSETYVPQYVDGDEGPEETKVMAWVVGYIVGAYASGDEEVRIGNLSAEGTIGLGNTASETEGSNCLSCQLISSTDPRTDLNLKSHNENLGKKVWVYGRVGSFTTSSKQVPGLRHTDYYSFDGVTIVPEMTGVNNITADEAKADGKIYNLSGMEVKTPVKGVYIQNGKKFVVK